MLYFHGTSEQKAFSVAADFGGFDGIFVTADPLIAQEYGERLHVLHINERDVLTGEQFAKLPTRRIIRENIRNQPVSREDMDILWRFVALEERSLLNDPDSPLYRLLCRSHDENIAYGQFLRGRVAAAFGFSAVQCRDERERDCLLALPGNKTTVI